VVVIWDAAEDLPGKNPPLIPMRPELILIQARLVPLVAIPTRARLITVVAQNFGQETWLSFLLFALNDLILSGFFYAF
jgi:hypothetical protein